MELPIIRFKRHWWDATSDEKRVATDAAPINAANLLGQGTRAC
ncbi:MAG TPA: hypothetical protein VH482_04925 [Thermomicrobiales bacterium]